jgi:hypothetical protein
MPLAAQCTGCKPAVAGNFLESSFLAQQEAMKVAAVVLVLSDCAVSRAAAQEAAAKPAPVPTLSYGSNEVLKLVRAKVGDDTVIINFFRICIIIITSIIISKIFSKLNFIIYKLEIKNLFK